MLTQQNKEDDPQLMIINWLDIPIIHVYISPAGENTWTDILFRPIPPGEGVVESENRTPIMYDIRAEDSEGNTYTFLNIDLTGTDGSVGAMISITPERRDN